jgi:hypothetical protein
MDYAEARMLQMRTGRFGAPDPIAGSSFDPQTWNRYVYGLNSPITNIDPTGLLPSECPGGYKYGTTTEANGKIITSVQCNSGPAMDWIVWVRGLFGYSEPHEPPRPGGGRGAPTQGEPGSPSTPPVVVPTLPSVVPKELRKAFEKAYVNAWNRLARRTCGDALGSETKAKDVMSKAAWNFRDGPGPSVQRGEASVNGAITLSHLSPQRVYINANGPFLNPLMIVPGLSGPRNFSIGGLRGVENGAAIILHETGHLTHVFGPDAGNQQLIDQYSKTVLSSCF